ncbi:MAG TPA: outer membrane beta-barrel protein [Beijerinckiaceae bacterium]|nr:outer membrane beta-barrel protein [Rhodoblastus sp.]HRY02556.1 outer membrane beta-barrel protein [Beijerinckiaceae bacterium]
MKWVFLAAAALASSAAVAADLPVRRSPPPPEPTAAAKIGWAGAYAGASLGAGWIRAPQGVATASPFGAISAFYVDEGSARPQARLFGGYNWRLTQAFYAGLEAGGTVGSGNAQLLAGRGLQGHAREAWSGDARVRLGVSPHESVMFYGFGGARLTSFRQSASGAAGFASNASVNPGWTIGGGAEAQITQHVRLRAEYSSSESKLPSTVGVGIGLKSTNAVSQSGSLGLIVTY